MSAKKSEVEEPLLDSAAEDAEDMEEENNLQLYELMVVLVPESKESERTKELEHIREMVREHQGNVKEENLWGDRPLQFRIKKRHAGYYAVFVVEVAPRDVAGLKESVKLFPSMLRSLFLALPKGYDSKKVQKQNERLAAYLEAMALKRPRRKKPMAVKHRAVPTAILPLKRIPEETPEVVKAHKIENKGEAPLEVKDAKKGLSDEEKLKAVDQKLSDILDNPDINLG